MDPQSKKLGVVLLMLILFKVKPSKGIFESDYADYEKGASKNEQLSSTNDEFRLPDSLIPISYDIKYHSVDLDKFTFEGSVRIVVKVMTGTDKIVLHKGDIDTKVLSVYQLSPTKEELKFKAPEYNITTQKFSILMENPLIESSGMAITLNFTGSLRNDMLGFYKSSYFTENGTQKWLAATKFSKTYARSAFPCFDEPAFKATFNISIQVPDGYSCLSNMPTKAIEFNKWCRFESTVKMSTYLVAFVVSDFEAFEIANPTMNPSIKVWSRHDVINQGEYALDIGQSAVKFLETKLDEKYQLPKLDMVAMPDFASGAMENWGIITYKERNVLYDENISSDTSKQRVASIISHEISHMWFGNLVTPKWWSYLWLSEGFATFFEYMITNEIEKSWRMDQQFVVDKHQLALEVDGYEDTVAMTRSASTQEEINKSGGTITYAKGASIIRMMENAFGTDTFYNALKPYLKNNKYRSTTPEDLWTAFQTIIDERDPKSRLNVSAIMKNWTEEPGYPYVNVSVNGDKIILEQERFFFHKSERTPMNMNWMIPISFWSSSQNIEDLTKPPYWLTETREEVNNTFKCDDWFITNVQSVGYYRVNYDRSSWKKIIKVLTSGEHEKIPVLNRAAILDDLLSLARAELVDYDLALTALSYLRNETNYLPFKPVLRELKYLKRLFSTSQEDRTFKEYMRFLLTKAYRELSSSDEKSDDHLRILLRREITDEACEVDHPECIYKAQKQFGTWKTNHIPVPKNSRSTVYCIAVKYGSSDDWEFLWKEYLNSDVASERTEILRSLSCSKNATILNSYLQSTLEDFEDGRIRKQDLLAIFEGIYSSSYNSAQLVLKFIEENYEENNGFQKNDVRVERIIKNILKMYPSKKLVSEVERIMRKIEDPDIRISLVKAIKLARIEIEWFKRNSKTILDWIRTDRRGDGYDNTKAYRLPGNVIPTAYALHLVPHIVPEKLNFTGTVTIRAEVRSSTDVITLHSKGLRIFKDNLRVFNLDDQKLEYNVLNITFVQKYDFLNINLNSSIPDRTRIFIRIHYEGNLTANGRGFYRSSYSINGKTRWLAATHLEPTAARQVFPCFDEPALKASFNISVRAPQGYKVLSNEEPSLELSNTWTFRTTPRMSTYLVTVVVSDFEAEELRDVWRRYRVWGNPVIKNYKQLEYALGVMKRSVPFFENKLGYPYELPKMDMVALPDFKSGAMENWGLLTYREALLVQDPVYVTPVTSKQITRNVITREISHQWFGDLVTPLWWDYIWLSEGFARYFEFHAYTEDEASWDLEKQFVVDHLQMSFSNDALKETHPVTASVYSPSEIDDIFDSISSGKAASLIRMLDKLVGQEIFYRALSNYLKQCEHSTGTPELLFKAFQDEMKTRKKEESDVAELMNSWTRQPGFPVLTVEFSENNEKLHLSQSRFYLRPVANETDKSTWIIPINWATKSDPDFNNTKRIIWMENENEKEISLKRKPEDWVILNLQQTGYYRVNYDKVMWKRIIDTLHSKDFSLIHEVNRASLLDDLFNLGRVGLVDYDLVFSALLYLRKETAYVPWKAALANLNYFRERFTGRPEIYGHFTNFVVQLLEPLYENLKFEDQLHDGHTTLLLRKLMLEWLCDIGFQDCVKKAHQLFDDYRKGNNITPNKRAVVYSTAVKYGNSENWDYLWDKLTLADNTTEKLTIIDALAYSPKPDTLKKLLVLASTEGTDVRHADGERVFFNVVSNGPIGVETALDFVTENYQRIRHYFGGDGTTKNILSSIGVRLTTPSLRAKFKEIVERSPKDMPSIAESLQCYLDRDTYDMNWYSTYGAQIFQWLDRYEPINQNPEINYRLPTAVVPESYNIYLQPYFEEKNFTFIGNTSIDVLILKDVFQIVLHYEGLKDVELEIFPDTYKVLDRPDYNKTTHKLKIYFAQLLTAGSTLQLRFRFTGVLADDDLGFYRSSYLNETGAKIWIAASQFEPTYARRAFPCFDEPSFKANFTVHIAKPKGYSTLSNMGSKPTEQTIGDVVWDHYNSTPKMSPYTLAFIVSDFIKVSANGSNVAVWGKKALEDYLINASTIGHESLKHLNKLTLIPFSWEEMNFVALPDLELGAMENWGLVTFRESYLTYDETAISAQNLKNAALTIVHELAHMWFGNLVTCDWWDYTWLNEGFAQFAQTLVGNEMKPDWYLMDQFVVTDMHLAMLSDSSESSRALNTKVLTPAEIQGGFDDIAYQKGASILRMFYKSFGWWVFSEAVHDYLESRKYDSSKPEHLVEAFQARTKYWGIMGDPLEKLDAKTIMDSWLSQPGYPVVNATRTGDTVFLSQERFLTAFNASRDGKILTYWIPISYTSGSSLNSISTDPKLWLGKNTSKIDLPARESWYLLNIDQVGFYRVNYDTENWNKLIQVLNSERFTEIGVANRAQLLDDSLNLARAGYVDIEIALRASEYLIREKSYVPWQSFLRAIEYIGVRVRGNGEIEQLFANYMGALITGPFNRIGFTESLGRGNHMNQLTREMIVTAACKYRIADCRSQARHELDYKRVTPNIAAAVYCSYIDEENQDDESRWDKLWNSYNESVLSTDKVMYLQSLGCSNNSNILERYLDYIVVPGYLIRRQDLDDAFKSVYSNGGIGLKTAMEYFKKNLIKVKDRYGNWDRVGKLLVSLSGYISTKKQHEELKDFANTTDVPEVQLYLQKALKTANENIEWFERYSERITSWLKSNYPLPNPPDPDSDDHSNSSMKVIVIFAACMGIVGALVFGLTVWYKRSTR